MELQQGQGEDVTSHTHASSPINDGLVKCVVSSCYPNSLLWGGGVKTDKKVYQGMLEELVKNLQNTLFEGSDYCFQQDCS